MKILFALLAPGLLATSAWAYEFHCGWRITSFDAYGCPAGVRDTDSCGCGLSAAPRWYSGQLAMKVENQGGNGITATDFVNAGRQSAQAWSDVSCSSFVFDASQTLAANSDARWGNNDNIESEHGVFFVTSSTEWMTVTGAGAGGTLGVTVSPYSWGCADRVFFDSDILINGFIQGGWTFNSVKSVVMHEMGHSLGLGHPCLLGYVSGQCSNDCQALMGAAGGDYITPQQDDINGICALYPGTPGGLGSACTSPAQCTTAPLCITYQGFSYCSHTCGSCETGYTCTLVDSQNVCVRKGAPMVGEVCTGICEEGASCIGDEGVEPDIVAHCYQNCDPAGPNTCTGLDYRCVPLEGGGGICWPPGTLQAGERCGDVADDCAPGLVCLLDVPNVDTYGHCYRECNSAQPSSCGSGFFCVPLGDGSGNVTGGACFVAARLNQDCLVTEYLCEAELTCAPVLNDDSRYTCQPSCDWRVAGSCGPGLTCVELWVDQQGNTTAAACYPEGDNREGEACVSGFDCAPELICVGDGSGGAECLVSCIPASSTCPHIGQTCVGLSGSNDGVCVPAGGSDPDPDPDPDPTGSKAFLEPCANNAECASGICYPTAGGATVCVLPCRPELGHFDCPFVQQAGCLPHDVNLFDAGGVCLPGVGAGTLAIGDDCVLETGFFECESGLCSDGLCAIPCAAGQVCPAGYQCDTAASPAGVCKPTGCGCSGAGSGPAPAAALALFTWQFYRRGRRRRS